MLLGEVGCASGQVYGTNRITVRKDLSGFRQEIIYRVMRIRCLFSGYQMPSLLKKSNSDWLTLIYRNQGFYDMQLLTHALKFNGILYKTAVEISHR